MGSRVSVIRWSAELPILALVLPSYILVLQIRCCDLQTLRAPT